MLKLIVNLCDFNHCKNLSSVKMCLVYTNECFICWSSQVFNNRSPNLEPQFNFDHSTRNILDKRGWSQWANLEQCLKIKLRRNQPSRIQVTRYNAVFYVFNALEINSAVVKVFWDYFSIKNEQKDDDDIGGNPAI